MAAGRLPISSAFSVFLDCVRVTAALLVVLAHCRAYGIATLPGLDDFGHEAVIVFFVLSGIVIRSTMSGSLDEYCGARAVRIYSVVLPAVLISYVTGYLLANQKAQDPWQEFFGEHGGILGLVKSLLFLDESWFSWTAVPANDPFWSLCYEVWYYVIFGCAMYLRGHKRVAWLLVTAVIAGPRILVLLPIWWAGVVFAEQQSRFVRSKGAIGWWMLVGGVVGIALIDRFNVAQQIKSFSHSVLPGLWLLRHSELFVADFMVAFCVLLSFAGFKFVEPQLTEAMLRIRRPVHWISNSTFSIYLYHYPIVLVVASRFGPVTNWGMSVALYVGVVTVCICLSYVTERRKRAFQSALECMVFPLFKFGRRFVP